MAYNQQLADKIRESIAHLPNIEEKQMFGGVTFMVDGKMCVGVVKEEMMCRINPELDETVLEMNGCRPMDFTGKRMRGYVFVNSDGISTLKKFEYFISLCLEFNSLAKASKTKSKRRNNNS